MPPAAFTWSFQSSKPLYCSSESTFNAPVLETVKPIVMVCACDATHTKAKNNRRRHTPVFFTSKSSGPQILPWVYTTTVASMQRRDTFLCDLNHSSDVYREVNTRGPRPSRAGHGVSRAQ